MQNEMICFLTLIFDNFIFVSIGNLSSGIEQLRTCNRCHRIFPVLSDLFNHMCDDEDDLRQRKSAMSSSSSSSYSSNKHTSDNLFHNNNNNKTKLDSSTLFDRKSSPNQGLSSRSFKLNRRSSFNDSLGSSLSSKKFFSPLSSSTLEQEKHSTSIHVSPLHRSINNRSSFDTTHIPLLKRPLFRPDSNHITRISSSPSSRPLFNDKQQHSSSAYVYLRNPSSPMRVVS